LVAGIPAWNNMMPHFRMKTAAREIANMAIQQSPYNGGFFRTIHGIKSPMNGRALIYSSPPVPRSVSEPTRRWCGRTTG
jgi:hypothetical protein